MGKRWSGWKKAAAGGILAAAVGVGTALPYFVGEKVVEVVDGDTFIIANRQPIRIYGVDAPNLGFCFGQEAKAALRKLVENKKVVLREPLTEGGGRVMALVYVDGKLVNEQLVRGGFGVYRRQAGSEKEMMKAANSYARDNNLGVYSSECYQKDPPNPKCPIKGNSEEGKGDKEYYLPECRYYDQVVVEKNYGEDWFCSEIDAQKSGYTIAASCRL